MIFFCIRLKCNRSLEIIEWKYKWKIMKAWELEEWNYTVKMKWVEQELFVFVKILKMIN